MTTTLVATPDPMIPNRTWKWDLPVWAVLALDKQAPDWRDRYHHVGTGLAGKGMLGVVLTDSIIFVSRP